jgi:hypothetical protein
MKRFLSSLLIILSVQSYSQDEIIINSKDVVSGEILESGKDITGVEFAFSERIQSFYVDTVNNKITLQLRGLSKNGKWLDNKGKLILLDL